MGSKLTSKLVHNICRLRFQNSANRAAHTEAAPNLTALLEKQNAKHPKQTNIHASIYKVPDHLRLVEPKAYEPNIVSIGPYHHEANHLQIMEKMKLNFYHRLFNPSKPDRPNLEAVVEELKRMEQKARGCYSEELKLSSNNFINMMLIDSCFIIELLRDAKETDSSKKSMHIKRWMLPVLQRDLIMLENQLPMFVLNKVYDLTSGSTCKEKENSSLKELALQFFEPMIYKDIGTPRYGDLRAGNDSNHFVELFRTSICPTDVSPKKFHGKEPHMFRSITDLKWSSVKVKKADSCQPLDVSFKKGVLKIAPVSMDDHRFTLFRNMVAFEQCHFACKPYVTAYIFFLDRLINSAEDIELLHYAGVMQHTLGGNKNAARLVNKLCKEVAGAADDSYLDNVLWKINCYCDDRWNQKKAKLKHEYFYNVWVSLSTLAAIVLIYFTILQTISTLEDGNDRGKMFGIGFWVSFAKTFLIPFKGKEDKNKSSAPLIDKDQINDGVEQLPCKEVCDETKPSYFVSCY